MRVFTVGHGTRPIEELAEMLAAAGVQTLVDVRRFPGSRRHPQFGRDALAAVVEEAGIAYRHAVELGGRRGASRARSASVASRSRPSAATPPGWGRGNGRTRSPPTRSSTS